MSLRFGGRYQKARDRAFFDVHVVKRSDYVAFIEKLAGLLADDVGNKDKIDDAIRYFMEPINFGYAKKREKDKLKVRRAEIKKLIIEFARARRFGFVVSESELGGYGVFLLNAYASNYRTLQQLLDTLNIFVSFHKPKSAEERQYMLGLKFVSVINVKTLRFLIGILSYLNHNMRSRIVLANSEKNLLKSVGPNGQCK